MIFGRYLNTMLYTPLILWLIFVDKSNASGRNLSSCRMSKKVSFLKIYSYFNWV